VNATPAIRDVLAEVDFELAQGVVARADLRRAIREIRRLHEKNRNAVFGHGAGRGEGAGDPVDLRAALRRQFQVDDMILAVLGEAVTAAEESRKEVLRLSGLVRESLEEIPIGGVDPATDPVDPADRTGSSIARAALGALARGGPAPREADPLDGTEDEEPGPDEDVEWAIRPERLQVPMDPRDPGLPLVGSIFGRLRNALHSRVLIYTGILGEKQTEVNQVLGDHLLRAVATLRRQGASIDALRLRVARLERRLAEVLGHGADRSRRGD
jgi:hypothetical protein